MKKIFNFSQWYESKDVVKNYIKSAPKTKIINWFNLPEATQLYLKEFPKEVKPLGKGKFVSVKRLKKICGKNYNLNKKIIGIKRFMKGNYHLKIDFPINLNTNDYVKLYSLMVSEGSTRTEFSLHVPEEYFHEMFKQTVYNLISKDFSEKINIHFNKGFLRSRAPAKTRKIIPIPEHIPSLILQNKNFARKYLIIAFDAEGSAIFDGKHKRYIKLSRYVDITNFVEEDLPLQKRIYRNKIKEIYPELFKKIEKHPPNTLLGESILLRKYFNINNKIELEAIKKNKTSLRAGKITARWVLFIYAENVEKFIQQIGFISKEKRKKCQEMLKVKTNRSQYTALRLMKRIAKDNIFLSKEFTCIMKKKGYVSPFKYIWSYKKKGLIEKVRKGKYKLIC